MIVAENLIAGVWEECAGTGPVLERSSPYGAVIPAFSIGNASVDQVSRAIQAAARAQEEWISLSVVEMGDSLRAAAGLLRTGADALAELLVAEVGKTVPEAIGEILNAARLLEFHSGSMFRAQGTVLASARPSTTVSVEWKPLGIVVAITPWNFPVNMIAVKLAPALAAGNAFVLKPSPEGACTASALIRLIAGCFPEGLLGLVHGNGDVGQALIADQRVSGVTFTGSTAVGQAVSVASAARGIPFQCEMGGRNTIAIMSSADLDVAIPAVAGSAFRMAGQKCTAAGSVVVHEDIFDAVVQRLVEQLNVGTFALGDPRDATTVVGPLIGPAAVTKVSAAVQDAVDKGARLIWPTDGVLSEPTLDGAYMRPVLLTDINSEMVVFAEEVFGPVLTVIPVRSVEEAAEAANRGAYGLVSAIFTRDLGEAMTFAEETEAGTILVNQPTTGLDFHIPFGGWGRSGQGPTEQSDDALHVYMRPKTRYLSWPQS